MLVTKRFYCFFPLVCIVLHQMTMFSMFQASPMDFLDSFGRLTQEIGEGSAESYGSTSGDAPGTSNRNVLNTVALGSPEVRKSLEAMVGSHLTRNQLSNMKGYIAQLNPSGVEINPDGIGYFYQDIGEMGPNVLELLFEKSSLPNQIEVPISGGMIPLFISDEYTYFLSKVHDGGYLVFSKPVRSSVAKVYGTIKPGIF